MKAQPARPAVGTWAGSNVDLASDAEVEADLFRRINLLDVELASLSAAAGRVSEARRAYALRYAAALATSESTSAAGRKRDAEEHLPEEKAELEAAEVAWELAKLVVRTAESQLSAVQTIAASRRIQLRLDTTTPEWTGGHPKVPR